MIGRHTMLECKRNLQSCYPDSHCSSLSFVDRDMLMHYTPHGIGHPTVVREILQNCANVELMDNALCEHSIQPCKGDVEQGGSDNDNEGESGDDNEGESDDSDGEESDAQDSDDQEMEDGEGEEDNFMSF
jgi:hypothetical protein